MVSKKEEEEEWIQEQLTVTLNRRGWMLLVPDEAKLDKDSKSRSSLSTLFVLSGRLGSRFGKKTVFVARCVTERSMS